MLRNVSRMMIVLSLCMLLTAQARAENITESNVSHAQKVIDAVVKAYGGSDAIDGLKSVYTEANTENTLSFQSRKPEPPWDKSTGFSRNAIDFENSSVYTENKGSGAGNLFHVATIIADGKGRRLDFRRKTKADIAEPDFNTTAGPFMRVTPVMLVKALRDRAHTATYLGKQDYQGKPHELVRFVMEVGPAITMYFDAKTYILNKSERMLPPFGLVEYFFEDYKSINGIPMNHKFVLHGNYEPSTLWIFKKIKINEPVVKWFSVPKRLKQTEAVANNDMSNIKLDEGVYLTGANGTYSLFVDMEDHIIAVGTTNGSLARYKSVKSVLGDKPLRYAVVTHHHNDHLAGGGEFLDAGATLLGVKHHKNAVKNAIGERDLKFENIDGKKIIVGKKNTLELIDIGPTPHTEHLLVAYLPNQGIVFEADHFGAPQSGPVGPATDAAKAFARALKKYKLKVNTIVGAHSPKQLTKKDLDKALKLAM